MQKRKMPKKKAKMNLKNPRFLCLIGKLIKENKFLLMKIIFKYKITLNCYWQLRFKFYNHNNEIFK